MSPLAALAAALLAVTSPFVAEQPRVKEGNEKLLSGDAAGALERYEQAEREAGPRPEIDFDKGHALHALGRHAEAREAWRRALEADRGGALSSRALQNMGNALDALGDREGAARAMAEALRRDPANEDARYNLEVLLRRKDGGKGRPEDQAEDQRRQQGPPEQGQGQGQDRPPQDRQQEQAQERAQGEERKPGEERQGQRPEQGQDERRPAGEDERQERGQDEAAARAGEQPAGADGRRVDAIGRQEAEKLLDAMRARERNMPLGPDARKDGRKREVSRDW